MSAWTDSGEIHDLLSPYFSREDGTLTKWVIVAEVHDGDHKKLVSLRGPHPDAAPIWDVVGMLHTIVDDDNAFGTGDDDE